MHENTKDSLKGLTAIIVIITILIVGGNSCEDAITRSREARYRRAVELELALKCMNHDDSEYQSIDFVKYKYLSSIYKSRRKSEMYAITHPYEEVRVTRKLTQKEFSEYVRIGMIIDKHNTCKDYVSNPEIETIATSLNRNQRFRVSVDNSYAKRRN